MNTNTTDSKALPNALRLADALAYCDASVASQAAAELRRLHAVTALHHASQNGRSEAEIVLQTVELTKYLLSWKWGLEPEGDASRIWESANTKANVCWNAACHIQDLLTQTDVWNAVAEVEGQASEQTGAVNAAQDDGDDPSREQYKRMFHAACSELGEVSDALGVDPDEGGAEPILAAIEQLRGQVTGPWMNAQDMKALQRVDECFEDGEGYDVPKLLMKRLSELGAVRRLARGAYEITAFGRFVLGSAHSRQPLETIDECNARLSREHRARLDAEGPKHGASVNES